MKPSANKIKTPKQVLGARSSVRKPSEPTAKALRGSEALLRSITDYTDDKYSLIRSMQDGFSVLNSAGVQMEVNPALCRMTGFAKEELVGIGPPFPYWPPEEYENIGAAFQETLKGNFADFELIFLRKNGERFPVIVSPAAIKNSDGETITYHATVKDITVRKQAEAALQESEERYKLLAENTDDIVGLNDTEGNRLYISPSYFRKTGWAPEDLQNVDWRFRIHPDDIEIVERARLQNLAGLATRIEHRTRRKDGSWFWCETSCKAIPGPDDKVWRLLVWSHDITARVEVEAALRESEEQFRAIFEQAAVGVAMIDSNTGRFLKVNQRACEIARLTQEEMLRETFMDITHPDDLPKDLDNMKKLRLGVIPAFNMEKRYLHPDGSITWINLTVSPMWKPGEAPTRHIAVVKDITARRRSEEALRNANQKLRLHFEQTPMAVIEWDLNFRVLSWNPAAQTIFGFSHEEAIGQHAAFIIPKIYRSQVGKVWQSLLKQKGGERSSNENVRKDGKTILCDWYNTPLIDDHGIVTGVASLVLDMSEKKQAEEAMLASEERYARALRGSNEGLWDWSNSTGELYLSPSWKALLGFSEDELPNHPDSFFTRLHPNDVARVQDAVAAHLERREPYDLDLRLRVKDGGYRWFRSRGEAERDEQGRAVRMAGTLYDISQRKFAEEKLAIEQDFNRALVSHTSALIIVLDELTRIIHVNAAFVRVLGYDLSMVAGRPLWETGMMSAAEIPRAKARYQQLLAGKEIAPVELRLKAKNGDWHVVELQPTAARHSDGSIDRIILTFTDMTERTRLQREILKISEQEQARIGHNLHDGVGQTMTGLSSLMESLESELSGAQRASATRIREIMQDALQEVRRMSHGLSPASVKNRGLSGALQLLADTLRFNHRTECVCEVDSTIKIEDAEKETHIFRIAQEASNNAIRHGHPKKVALSLQRLGEEECVLKIENDGAAIVKKKGKPSEGIGMQVMDYRANLIGGTLSITSSPRTGVSVSCRFPYADGGRKKSRSTNSWDI
ncbi:MAG: PAS domain S-box protein [Prosthecobacter sp.]